MYLKRIIHLFLFVAGAYSLNAQNQVGVNTSTVDGSAVFEMLHSSRGLLIPRMTSNQRNSITSPANGLLVYVTSTNSFWYYQNGWGEIISNSNSRNGLGDTDGDTRIISEFTTDNDQIRYYQNGTEHFRMNANRLQVYNNGNSVFIGDSAGYNDDRTNNQNTFIGTRSGQETANGARNVAIGFESFQSNVGQSDVVAIGYQAGRGFVSVRRSVVIGSNNTETNITQDNMTTIGHDIMPTHTARNNNAAVGIFTLGSSNNTRSNIAVGNEAMGQTISGGFNVALGYKAGESLLNSNSILLGHRAGELNTAGNRLFIDNSNTNTPLIWANFNLDSVVINGDLHITEDLVYVGELTDASDRRLKDDILKVNNQLPKIQQLQAYRYYLKSSSEKRKEYGLIAQDVQKVYPSIVSNIDEKGHIGVSYVQLIPLLLEGEKEQYKILSSRQSKLDALETEIGNMEGEIQQIKKRLQSGTSADL